MKTLNIKLTDALNQYCPTLYKVVSPVADWNEIIERYNTLSLKRHLIWKIDIGFESKANFFDLLSNSITGDIKSIGFLAEFDRILNDLQEIIPSHLQTNLASSIYGRINNFEALNYMTVIGELFALYNVLSKEKFKLIELDSPRVSNLICTEYLKGQELKGDFDFKFRIEGIDTAYLVEIGNILNLKIERIKNENSLLSTLGKNVRKKIKEKTEGIQKENLKNELFFVFIILITDIEKWLPFRETLIKLANNLGREFSSEYHIFPFLSLIQIPWSNNTYRYKLSSIQSFIEEYLNYPK